MRKEIFTIKVQFLHGIHLESRINSLQVVAYSPTLSLSGLSHNLPQWGNCVTTEIKACAGDHLKSNVFQRKRQMFELIFQDIFIYAIVNAGAPLRCILF